MLSSKIALGKMSCVNAGVKDYTAPHCREENLTLNAR